MLKLFWLVVGLVLGSQDVFAFFLDGTGHYAARGLHVTNPAGDAIRGTHQAIEQSAALTIEARANERASFFTEWVIFSPQDASYMGDKAQPYQCMGGEDQASCGESSQNTSEPGYQAIQPTLTKAYMRYAMEACVLEAGRRERSWGLGLFLDSGRQPFAKRSSVYDGVACRVNIQREQSLGFAVGYDKLAETGRLLPSVAETDGVPPALGPNNASDDVDQIYFIIEYDDRRNNAGAFLTKQIGFYAAKINSGSVSRGGLATDLSFLDIYSAFYIPRFVFSNEVLLRLGKTADPSTTRLGGASDDRQEASVNRMDAIGLAGRLEFNLSQSGQVIGPESFRQGDLKEHQLFAEGAYAPGDERGYYLLDSEDPDVGAGHRSASAKAMAFHEQFKPALILFNGKRQLQNLRIDGVFDPSRFMNARLLSLGYRYKDLSLGVFEVKCLTASLVRPMPDGVHDYYEVEGGGTKPVGYYGSSLGYELDAQYTFFVNSDLDVGLAVGALLPGAAWQTSDSKPAHSFLGQASLTFRL